MSKYIQCNCPYCGENTFKMEGMWLTDITDEEMLKLFNTGWRRFGHYCWRQVKGSCCEQHPIRTDVTQFITSDGHKKVWKRIEKHVRTGKGKGEPQCPKQKVRQAPLSKGMKREKGCKEKHRGNHHIHKCPAGHQMKYIKGKRPRTELYAERVTCDVCLKPGLENFPEGYYHCGPCSVDCHPGCIIPKTPGCHSCGKAMTYLVNTLPVGYKFVTCDVCQGTELINDDRGYYHCHDCLLDRHIDDRCSFQSFPHHIINTIKGQSLWEYRGVKEIEVRVVEPSFTTEKYDLFLKYHKIIHGEEEGNIAFFKLGDFAKEKDDRKKFCDILVNSPIKTTRHVEYRLDGKLFIVTVMDILPGTINSVYCFYDPEDRWFMPGRLSILYEIAWARSTGMRYYSLGSYNTKMAYKADYRPYQLLNPESRVWEECGGEGPKKECQTNSKKVSFYLWVLSVPLAVAFISVIGRSAMDSVMAQST
eukprot:TRINITY_DN3116_c2_g1_i1.p1 TRINITY_DN3116_c2_g1~~TRINITY_DN3116_c2_g1_i1.p1  ORF type:complete len:488 (+),score=79.18 TRINITY_DN3116_c2_g1_i1:44-1465(+)